MYVCMYVCMYVERQLKASALVLWHLIERTQVVRPDSDVTTLHQMRSRLRFARPGAFGQEPKGVTVNIAASHRLGVQRGRRELS